MKPGLVKRWCVTACVAALSLGCGAPPQGLPRAGERPGEPGGEQPPIQAPVQWQPAGEDFSDTLAPPRTTLNQTRLLVDGPEIFPAMEKMIEGARKQIEVDYFVFSGRQGLRLAHLLAAKAREGVHVDVVFDPGKGFTPMFTKSVDQVIAVMEAGGVHVTGFPVGRLPRRPAINKVVDHDKVVVVDRERAMVGGMNIADVFDRNHDVMLEVKGPIAADIGRMLASDRRASLPLKPAKGVKATPPEPITVPPDIAPPMPAQPVGTRIVSTGINRTGYKEILLERIRSSRKSIHVLMFQLVDDDVVKALTDAARRRVDVRIILDPGDHDELIPVIKKAPLGFPNLPYALQLLKGGVGVKWYRLDKDQVEMHAKVGVFDGQTMLLGSTNWIPSAFLFNNEASLLVDGGPAVSRMEQVFEADWARKSDPVVDKGVTQDVLSWIIARIPYL
ncbi:MAG: phosphatidylserine/phosphatidylglycerophosphate/cardiolipin synthase family protein [Candidatus Sericytochromatia bacterium]|uniref:Phosphatidylserine/phosphatidylglycerophosphate/ cardiolipin synthase family protein n=1 Tax=Candidatus Tanganyikabacteria bacterium TaxID=2961651 RepID=A0A937X7U9_9BACT|nr:phosphatidylserine/phosphatidylglycerophosphate/cardiolipin synthase family protein [Candidatus Tanganyikabacteria bacterium]